MEICNRVGMYKWWKFSAFSVFLEAQPPGSSYIGFTTKRPMLPLPRPSNGEGKERHPVPKKESAQLHKPKADLLARSAFG
jgi:hypothetical protein